MRVLVDACVLYPTVLREIVLGCAGAGAFAPLWSARILEEWARAVGRMGPGEEAVARGEIAVVRARWPEAEVAVDPATEARLWLPDPDDVHVLAAAVDGAGGRAPDAQHAGFSEAGAGCGGDPAPASGRVPDGAVRARSGDGACGRRAVSMRRRSGCRARRCRSAR